MRTALELAARGEGRTRPNPPVGAVLVRHGCAVGSGHHRKAGKAHAEVVALRRAGPQAAGSTLYVTLEPCSTRGRTGPCTEAIEAQGVKRVVIGCRDPNPKHAGRGIAWLRRRGIAVEEGVLRREAEDAVAPFASWVLKGRPLVTLKLGMSLDGRIGDRDGRSRWITGSAARRRVRLMRRKVDAVLVGRGTACEDDPSLLAGGGDRDRLLRVIVDSRGRLPLSAKVLTDACAAQTVVATTNACGRRQRSRLEKGGASVWVLPAKAGRVSLKSLMSRLGRAGLLHVLCEGGGELAEALVREHLVDRFALFLAPMVLGGSGVASFGGRGRRLDAAWRMKFVSCERMGRDVLLEAVPVRK